MEISGDYVFDAPQKMVWEALLDPNVLGSILPGGQGIELIGENEYKGMLQIKVGPVQGNFQGNIKLSEINPPESYKIEVDGKGGPGFVKATGSLHLEVRDAQTFMTYAGQAQVGGRIASVGQRLLDSSARSIIRQSLDALNAYLKVQVAQQAPPVVPVATESAPTTDNTPATSVAPADVALKSVATVSAPVPEYKPPSQVQLGFNVARDVFNDMIPAQYRLLVVGGIFAVILLIIWWFVSR